MDARRKARVALGTTAALVALAVMVQRARTGVELLLIALALVLAGPAFRRWLASRGRAAGPPPFVFLLELAAFSGLVVHPVGWWAHALAALAALAVALPWLQAPREESPRASWLEEGIVLAIGLVALAATGRPLACDPRQEFPWALLVLAVLAIEAYGPLAPRTIEAASRRAASFALAGGAALIHGYEERTPWVEGFLLVAAALAAVAAGREVALRTWHAREARATERPRRVVQGFFGVSLVGAVSLSAFYPGLVHEEKIDLLGRAPRHLQGHAYLAELPRLSLEQVPLHTLIERRGAYEVNAKLFEDGVPLRFPDSVDIAALGSGRYEAGGHRVCWSSSDGTSPLTNGRRYELVYETTYRDALGRTWPSRILIASTLLLGSLAGCLGGLRLVGSSPHCSSGWRSCSWSSRRSESGSRGTGARSTSLPIRRATRSMNRSVRRSTLPSSTSSSATARPRGERRIPTSRTTHAIPTFPSSAPRRS